MPKKAKHSHRQAQSAVKEKRKANVVATEVRIIPLGTSCRSKSNGCSQARPCLQRRLLHSHRSYLLESS